MKVLYIHQYFKVNSGGTRSYEFSKYLTSQNHSVTMITGTEINDHEVENIKVKSTGTKYHQSFTFMQRIISFIHFMIKSTLIGLKEKNIDVIYATSTPLTVGIPTLLISKLKRRKYVFEVRDVWPDVPIEMGFIKSKLLQNILFKLEKIIYKHAEHIVVLSEGMKRNLLRKGVNKEKITVITNLSMNQYYDEIDVKPRDFYRDKLLCIHPGTMGKVNGLDFILDVAETYNDDDIVYLLIGEGNQKERLKERIEQSNIKNVIIQDALPKDQVMKLIKQSDVGIMIVDNYKILEDNSANKFFDFLAAGLPVVLNYEGWQKQVLERNNAGRGFNYRNKKEFYNYLVELKNNPEKRKLIGNNAKRLAIEKYDSLVLSKKMESVLTQVLNNKK